MSETIYKIGNKILKIGGKLLTVHEDAPTPSLPPFTIRLKYQDGVTPSFYKGTGVQVSSSPNVWDLTYENSDWSSLLQGDRSLLEVIDANSTGVSDMHYMFYNCQQLVSVQLFDTSSVTSMSFMFNSCSTLTSVPLFNTSSVTSMFSMFNRCSSLTSVPLFDTSSVTNMTSMFYYCYKVESGALELYQQASTQATVPSHSRAFRDCGRDTVTGAAELAQIPSDWK